MSSLARRSTSAVQWNITTSVTTLVVQVAVIAVLARLLTPSDFGVFAIANVVLVVTVHLSQPGLITAIIREPILDRDVVGSIVGLSLGIAATFAAICFITAPLIASAGRQPDQMLIEQLIRLTSLTVFLSG